MNNRYLNRCQLVHLRRLVGRQLASDPAVQAAWVEARALADHQTLTRWGAVWQPYHTRIDKNLVEALSHFCQLTGLEAWIVPYAGSWAPQCHLITVIRPAEFVIDCA